MNARTGRGLLAALLFLVGCDAPPEPPPSIEYEVVATFAHDTTAYTQGLLVDGRVLVESTGQYGRSAVRRIDIESGEVLAETRLDSAYFGEGLAKVGEELAQLTWKAERAFFYDASTLEPTRTADYSGDGWGLCYDGASLFMSNGGDHLVRRDPADFAALDSIQVTSSGISVFSLNELECVGEFIYANVYQTNRIVRIEKATGRVVGQLDLSAITLQTRRPPDPGAVLNGIAYIAETETFLVTGKLWPTVYAIRLTS